MTYLSHSTSISNQVKAACYKVMFHYYSLGTISYSSQPLVLPPQTLCMKEMIHNFFIN
jgi:hypothetical protein